MNTKWTSKSLPETPQAAGNPLEGWLDSQFVVLLLYGKNSFGDKIYSYAKINLTNLKKLKSAIDTGQGFTPSDFGEVIAAGKGEPSAEVRAEVASMYQVIDSQKSAQAAAPASATEKKNWDEY